MVILVIGFFLRPILWIIFKDALFEEQINCYSSDIKVPGIKFLYALMIKIWDYGSQTATKAVSGKIDQNWLVEKRDKIPDRKLTCE